MQNFIVYFLISFICFSIPAQAKSQLGIVCVLPISATAVIDEEAPDLAAHVTKENLVSQLLWI